MTLSRIFWGVAAAGALSTLLIGYFYWRPGQAPLPIKPIQEETITDLEAANAKAAKERETLRKAAQAHAMKAQEAQNEAARVRARLAELEAQMGQIKAQRGPVIATPEEAMKELTRMGWVR